VQGTDAPFCQQTDNRGLFYAGHFSYLAVSTARPANTPLSATHISRSPSLYHAETNIGVLFEMLGRHIDFVVGSDVDMRLTEEEDEGERSADLVHTYPESPLGESDIDMESPYGADKVANLPYREQMVDYPGRPHDAPQLYECFNHPLAPTDAKRVLFFYMDTTHDSMVALFKREKGFKVPYERCDVLDTMGESPTSCLETSVSNFIRFR